MHQQPRRRQRPRHPLGQARTIRQQPQHRQPGMRHHALTIRGDYQPRDQPVTFTLEVLLDLNRCGSSTTPSNQVRSTFYLRRSYRLAHSRNRHTATPRRLNPTQETPCTNPSPPTSRPTTPAHVLELLTICEQFLRTGRPHRPQRTPRLPHRRARLPNSRTARVPRRAVVHHHPTNRPRWGQIPPSPPEPRWVDTATGGGGCWRRASAAAWRP